jgi:dienelactone hydrolase
MIAKDIAYEAAGTTLTGYLADDERRDGRRPGILLCHQGGGLTEHTKERARMLAELGYVAFALDMYGEVAAGREQAMSLIAGLTQNPSLLRSRAHAGLEALKSQPGVDAARLAAIGFCFGGSVVLELARTRADLAAVVAFHPGLTDLPESDPRKIACKVMVCAGIQDPLIPPTARERLIDLMIAADADWQLLVYGGAGHSFTDKSVDAMGLKGFFYHQRTDARSWAAMKHLFDETLGAP